MERFAFRQPDGVKIFQSYPHLFKFDGTDNQKLKCIGNSVPPLFMRAIARHITKIFEQILKNHKALA